MWPLNGQNGSLFNKAPTSISSTCVYIMDYSLCYYKGSVQRRFELFPRNISDCILPNQVMLTNTAAISQVSTVRLAEWWTTGCEKTKTHRRKSNRETTQIFLQLPCVRGWGYDRQGSDTTLRGFRLRSSPTKQTYTYAYTYKYFAALYTDLYVCLSTL